MKLMEFAVALTLVCLFRRLKNIYVRSRALC